MKIIKRVLIVGVVLVVLLVIAGVVVFMKLDTIVAGTVRTQATKQLNLQTDLDSASVSLFGGELGLNGLQIASPQGFAAPHMLTLGKAGVQVGYSQLRQNPVHIHTITLDKPRMVIEQKGGTFNFKQAIDQMPKGESTEGDKTPGGEKQPSAPKEEKPPLKLIIDAFTISDAQIVVRPNLPGLPEEIKIPAATFTLKNIGNDDNAQNGAAVQDVVKQLMTALAAQANSSKLIPPELAAILQGDLSSVVNQLGAEAKKRLAGALPGEAGQMVGQLLSNPSDLVKNPGQAVQQLEKSLGGNPATNPALPAKAQDLLGGMLGGKKDKKKKDN